jgi:hypothetical protein
MEGRAKTVAILNDVDPHDVRGNLVILATAAKFYYDHMIQDDTRLLLEKVIGQVVGQPVRVTCELVGDRPSGDPPRNGRPLRPVPSSPTPMQAAAVEQPSAPVTVAPAPPTNGMPDVMTEPPMPTAAPEPSGGNLQRIANLFDAQVMDDDEPPPTE